MSSDPRADTLSSICVYRLIVESERSVSRLLALHQELSDLRARIESVMDAALVKADAVLTPNDVDQVTR